MFQQSQKVDNEQVQVNAPAQAPAPALSNSAAQEDAGLAQAAPAKDEASVVDSIVNLGSMASVVLDAMPLPVSLGLFPRLLGVGAYDGWLADKGIGTIATNRPDLLDALLDRVLPRGLGIEASAAISAALAVDVGSQEKASVRRVDDGSLRVGFGTTVSVGAGIGAGAEVTGAFGDALLSGQAGASSVSTWNLTVEADLGMAGAELVAAVGLGSLLSGRFDAAALVTDTLPTAEAIQFEMGLATQGTAKATLDQLMGIPVMEAPCNALDAAASITDGAGAKVTNEGVVLSFEVGAGASVKLDTALAEVLGVDVLSLDASVGGKAKVEVLVDDAGFVRGTTTTTTTDAQGSLESRVEHSTPESLLASMTTHGTSTTSVAELLAGSSVTGLTRTFSRTLTTEQADRVLPAWAASLEAKVADKGAVACRSELAVEAVARVDAERVAEVLGGVSGQLPADAADLLGIVMDVALSGRAAWGLAPELCASCVTLEQPRLKGKVRLGLGIGVGGSLAVSGGASVADEAAITVDAPYAGEVDVAAMAAK